MVDVLILIARLAATIIVAMVFGKLLTKIKMPAILGFLLAGMVMGPYALNVLSYDVINSGWYHVLLQIFELTMGLMLAKELVFKNIKSYGKQLMTITIFESLGTFAIVALLFGVVFYFMGVPYYVALIFGAVALATAPAPVFSIVNEFKTKGELTKSIVPIAILDDVVAIIVFFSVNAFVASMGTSASVSPILAVAMNIGLPIVMGIGMGFVTSKIYKPGYSKAAYRALTIIVILSAYGITYVVDNYVLPQPSMNYMMVGLALFTTLTNIAGEEVINHIYRACIPIVSFSLMLMITNTAAPLDYHLIYNAGILTFVYILSRGLGKYFFTYLGAKVSGASDNVKKYLGLTLLPHSGVSLLFSGLAISSLNTFDEPSAVIVKGTIAAAAVINEIVAVVLAKKGFELAGEIEKPQKVN